MIPDKAKIRTINKTLCCFLRSYNREDKTSYKSLSQDQISFKSLREERKARRTALKIHFIRWSIDCWVIRAPQLLLCKVYKSLRQECCFGGWIFSEFLIGLPRGFYPMSAMERDNVTMLKNVGIDLWYFITMQFGKSYINSLGFRFMFLKIVK